MKIPSKQKNDFSIIIDIMIFLTVISIVGITRLFIIYFKGDQKLDLSYIENANYISGNSASSTNISMATVVKNTYDVDIVYGTRSSAYCKSVNASVLYDDEKIFNMIKKISDALKKYPNSIIKEIESHGYNVTIYLVDTFNSDNLALANRTASGEFRIYLSYQGGIERALHHEAYHILDYYAKLENDENMLYKEWNKYNPEGFEYTNDVNKITAAYVYIEGDSTDSAYFVTPYAKYSQKEDRAETFAELMTDTSKKPYYEKKEKIYNKMWIIRNTLYTVFESVNTAGSEQYFERYL